MGAKEFPVIVVITNLTGHQLVKRLSSAEITVLIVYFVQQNVPSASEQSAVSPLEIIF